MIPARRAWQVAYVLLLCTAPGCGLTTAAGWQDRGRDLGECFTLTVAAGPEISADVKLTEALHLAVGGGVHGEAGLIHGAWGSAAVATLGLPVAPFLEDGILYGRYLFTEASGGWSDAQVQDECYAIHLAGWAPTNPSRPWIDRFDLEVGVTVLLGVRAGFSPGQFVDLLAGCFGGDPAGDDG